MKRKAIIISAFAAVLVLAALYFIGSNEKLEVATAVVTEGSIEKYAEELGTVRSDDRANIYSFVSGRAVEIPVSVGDSVKEGDVLVRIDTQQLERQLAELQAMRSEVEAQYREALSPFSDNDVKKAELDISDMEGRLRLSEADAVKSEQLFEAGALSEQEYQRILLNLESERTALKKARLGLEQMKSPLSQNLAMQFEAKLRQLDIQQEELESRSRDLRIISPINGVVMMLQAEKGSFIQQGMQLAEIANIGELYIESDVLVADIAGVSVGAPVKISNKELNIFDAKGTVRKIHPQAFSKISDLGIEQKRIKVEIDIAASLPNLKPGYDLDIKIITDKKDRVLLIPEAATFQRSGRDYVFVDENGTARLREIQIGLEGQKQVEVVSGLSSGERVVLSPDERLQEGTRIK